MLRLSTETLEEYLRTYGWDYQTSTKNSYLTGWQGDKRSYPLKIVLNDTWVLMQVKPLIKLGIDWDSWPELPRYLLELNNDCQLIKIGIDEYGEVNISLQLFSMNVSYEEFSDALGVIGYYAELLYDQIDHRLNDIGFFTYPPAHMLI